MKEWYFKIFGLTLVIAVPDGSDGWLWRSEFEPPKSRHIQTSLFCVRIVESYMGWVGVEFVFLVLVVLLKWNAPNKAYTRRGAGGASESQNTVAPRG